jgi:hypothetical protein
MKLYRVIDKNIKIFLRDDFSFDAETEIGLDVEPSQGLRQPKWNGTEWVESATKEYIDSLKVVVQEITMEQRVKALETELQLQKQKVELIENVDVVKLSLEDSKYTTEIITEEIKTKEI